MSVLKVQNAQALPAAKLEPKHKNSKVVNIQTPAQKQSCGEWLLEKIQKIWKAICDFICCRICKRSQSIQKPSIQAESNDSKKQISFENRIKPNPPKKNEEKDSTPEKKKTDSNPWNKPSKRVDLKNNGTSHVSPRQNGHKENSEVTPRGTRHSAHDDNHTHDHTHGHAHPAHDHNHAHGHSHDHTHGHAHPAHDHNHSHGHTHDHAHDHIHGHTHPAHDHNHAHGHTHDHSHGHAHGHTHPAHDHNHSHGHSHAHSHAGAAHTHRSSDKKRTVNVNAQVHGHAAMPSTPISDSKKIDALPANTPQLITLPFQGEQVLSHARIVMKSSNPDMNHPPAYVAQILTGDAGRLLIDADMENLRQPTNWGTGEIAALGECSCSTLSRTKHPEYRREFDDTVIAHVVPLILHPNTRRYTITNFATGYLFASFVQAVQTIKKLEEERWRGRIIWNVIDTDYVQSIRSNMNDGSNASKAILCFKDQMAKLLPPGMELELNVFGSSSDYIFASREDRALRYDFIMGMDLSHAQKAWDDRELSIAAKPDAFEFNLAKVRDERLSLEAAMKGIGKPKCYLRKVNEPALAYEPMERSERKTKAKDR